MTLPAKMLDKNGDRIGAVSWELTMPQEYNMIEKITILSRNNNLTIMEMKNSDVGLFKLNEKIKFKVKGKESNLYTFFNILENYIHSMNEEIDKEIENKNESKDESLFKKIFKLGK